MKSRIWMWMTAAYLLAALAMPVGMAAQDNPSPDNKPKHKKYKLIDLGTFGGPASIVNAEGNGGPYINSRGAVIGAAQTTVPLSPTSNGYLCGSGPNVPQHSDGRTGTLWTSAHFRPRATIAATLRQ